MLKVNNNNISIVNLRNNTIEARPNTANPRAGRVMKASPNRNTRPRPQRQRNSSRAPLLTQTHNAATTSRDIPINFPLGSVSSQRAAGCCVTLPQTLVWSVLALSILNRCQNLLYMSYCNHAAVSQLPNTTARLLIAQRLHSLIALRLSIGALLQQDAVHLLCSTESSH